jgi:hypothetical protein
MVQTIGTAIYKARSMWATYEPASMYDDIKLCNNADVYKNSGGGKDRGLLTKENEYLKNLKPKVIEKKLEENSLMIYPNPASEQLNIKYKAAIDTKFEIVNMLGQIIVTINLSKDVQFISVNVNNLFAGIYVYKQTYKKQILNSGKLIIEK